ncbi:MAG: GGDEF domain-containing protein [Desulfosporosinus sp.]|nr:GGDEF domain-containing protein [Desulfosporosinus sp.]
MYTKSNLKDTQAKIRSLLSGTIVIVILILIQGITYLWLRVMSVALIAIGLFLVIQKLSFERRRLFSLVTLDELTRIGNYRAFQERMRLETQRAQRNHDPLTLILIDLDRFKNYNDSLGHRLGNELLYSAGQIFQSAVRSIDGVYRFGGDEFAIVLPETDLEAARNIVNRIQHSFRCHPNRAEVTLSMGMGTYQEESLHGFFDRVDHLLYDVKENGGNGCQSELSSNYAHSKGISRTAL